ncbi:site-specific integrase [Novosphingobium clariflavum]|uniref:Integrase n=1 Tax=Novosphingobium clariflavum TaxID=2029884 RepID=A0ABV6S7M0_9SPHN|nr:integrase [Novosphingobium clariflavum]
MDRIVSIYAPGEANVPVRGSGQAADRLAQVIALVREHAGATDADLRSALEARAPASLKALVNDFSDYRAFVVRMESPIDGRRLLPADPAEVLAYVQDCRAHGQKPATIRRRLASLRALHGLAGLADPTGSPQLRAMLKELAGQGVAAPLQVSSRKPAFTLEILLEACEETPPGLRDAALLAVACEAGLKVSQVLALAARQVVPGAEGQGLLRLAGAPERVLTGETFQRVDRWCRAAGIAEGALFRRVAVVRAKGREGRSPVPLAKLAWNARAGDGHLGERQARTARTDYVVGEHGLTAAAVRDIVRKVAGRAADLGLVALHGREREAAIAALRLQSLWCRGASDEAVRGD